jgi:hypothetical protein
MANLLDDGRAISSFMGSIDGEILMKTYAISTETSNGTVVNLKLPLMTYQQAKDGAAKLRELQHYSVFVINTEAE